MNQWSLGQGWQEVGAIGADRDPALPGVVKKPNPYTLESEAGGLRIQG